MLLCSCCFLFKNHCFKLVSIMTLLAVGLLSGCGNKNSSTKSGSGDQTTAMSTKPKSMKSNNYTTFKNGKFENKNTKIKILKTQVGHDNQTKKMALL